MLMERANRSLVGEEAALYRTARRALADERGEIMSAFERCLREHIDKRMAGDAETKADFSKVDATKLTLIDTSAMDESVLTGNIRRNVENFCHEELLTLNRGMGYLLGRPDLETDGNPLAPAVIVDSFAAALRGVPGEERVKLAILRELNQSSLGDLNGIYADLNRHLDNLHVVPSSFSPTASARAASAANRPAAGSPGGPGKPAKHKAAPEANAPGPELDLMTLFRQMHGGPPTFPPANPPPRLGPR